MKQKKEIVIIRPKGVQNSILTCQTKIGENWFVLTDDWRIMTLSAFNQEFTTNKSLRIKEQKFSESHKQWRIEFYLDDPYDAKEIKSLKPSDPAEALRRQEENMLNARIRTAVVNFFSKHMSIEQVIPFGNGHIPASGAFEIDWPSQKARIFHINDMNRVKVFEKIMAMSASELYNVVMYYAPELYNRTRSGILQGLIGLKGIGSGNEDNMSVMMRMNNLNDFLRNYEQNPNAGIRIVVNKAKSYGIIRESNGLWWMRDVQVGHDINSSVAWFLDNQDEYRGYLIPEVESREVLPEDDLQTFQTADIVSVMRYIENKKEDEQEKSADIFTNVEQLRQEAARLGIKNYQMMGYQKLLERVKEQIELKRNSMHGETITDQMTDAIHKQGLPVHS